MLYCQTEPIFKCLVLLSAVMYEQKLHQGGCGCAGDPYSLARARVLTVCLFNTKSSTMTSCFVVLFRIRHEQAIF
jgi:hypothetical protein